MASSPAESESRSTEPLTASAQVGRVSAISIQNHRQHPSKHASACARSPQRGPRPSRRPCHALLGSRCRLTARPHAPLASALPATAPGASSPSRAISSGAIPFTSAVMAATAPQRSGPLPQLPPNFGTRDVRALQEVSQSRLSPQISSDTMLTLTPALQADARERHATR